MNRQAEIESEVPRHNYALIIGISEYSDSRIPKLNFTHADARSFYELIVNPSRAGFPPENVRLLLDDEATLYNLRDSISGWLFQNTRPNSTVIVYFAGHGGQESDKLNIEADGVSKYLLPWDTNPDNLFASALSNIEFNRQLATIKSQRLVIFLDACYAAGVTQGNARDVTIKENPFARMSEGNGRIVIASAQPNQRSFEDPKLGHGIFTHHLLEALQGKADSENDGYVSILDAYKYLEREVPRSVRELANSVQEPLMCGDISKDIILTANADRIAEIARERSEAARRRNELIQTRRRKLFELHDSEDLPIDAYTEASALVTKERAEMSPAEQRLFNNIEALIDGGISVSIYLENRASIKAAFENSPTPEKTARPITQTHRAVEKPAAEKTPANVAAKFCVRCGTKLIPDKKFCNGCGTRVSQS
jgi:uncharacterized caspase-like protein